MRELTIDERDSVGGADFLTALGEIVVSIGAEETLALVVLGGAGVIAVGLAACGIYMWLS